MRALLVEDDPAIAEFVARGLREAGFAVDEAADSERALTTLSVEPYDAAMGALRPWHLAVLLCAGLSCTAVVAAVVVLVTRSRRPR